MDPILCLLFLGISTLYSSIGFGGGSSYIAVLILWNVHPITVTIIAALCNIVVTFNSSILYFKNKIITIKEILPFIILSVPFSFLGGLTKIPIRYLCIILGICLLISSIFLIIQAIQDSKDKNNINNINEIKNPKKNIIGALLGYIAGLTGIGGGIFLSPILHLKRYLVIHKISAVTSSFILVNAIAGLIGRFINIKFHIPDLTYSATLTFTVLLGSILGTYISFQNKYVKIIKFIVAIVIILAAFNLLKKYL